MKLKFVSDGKHTRVLDAVTGEELVGVGSFSIIGDPGEPLVCNLWLYGIEIDMLAELPEERREDDAQRTG